MELMERRRILLNTPHIDIVTGFQFVTDMVAPIESLVISFSPIQDLHGYDNPWPAGGGKNLLDTNAKTGSSNSVTYTNNGDGTYTVNGTASGTSTFVVGSVELTANTQYTVSGCPSGGSGRSYNVRIRDANYNALGFDVGVGATITPTETQTYYYQITVNSGCSVSNLVFKPMICLSTAPNPDYAHFAPYSNICPITGWTGLDVTRTGKNLFGVNNFTLVRRSTRTKGINFPYMPPGQYALSVDVPSNTSTIYVQLSVRDNNTLQFVGIKNLNIPAGSTGSFSTSFTADIPFSYLYAYMSSNDENDAAITITNIQLELGSTATAYEPYQGETYTITFPSEAGTVYGGTLDVTNGTLTVDRAMVDMGTLTWRYVAAFDCYYSYLTAANGQQEAKVAFRAICSIYPFVGAYNNLVDKSCAYIYNQAIAVRDSAYADAATFKTAMNGVQLVYELATPQTYQLTPQQVLTLKGTNNLLSNSNGGMTVNYWTHLD